MYIVRMLTSKGDFEELEGVKWDISGLKWVNKILENKSKNQWMATFSAREASHSRVSWKSYRFALTSAYYDEDVKRFYEDLEGKKKYKKQYSFIVGDFNAKIGKNMIRMTTLGNFGADICNDRVQCFYRCLQCLSDPCGGTSVVVL